MMEATQLNIDKLVKTTNKLKNRYFSEGNKIDQNKPWDEKLDPNEKLVNKKLAEVFCKL